MSRLANKKAVITGGSSGIGKAIALEFANEGAAVVVNYNHSQSEADDIVENISKLGGSAYAVAADVSIPGDVEQLINKADELLGGIDIWVNNAGANILTGEGAGLNDDDKLQKLIDTDLKGTINCCWSLIPLMQQQGQGVILNMSWDLAQHGFTGINPQMFAAVKAGITGFSKSLAKTHGPMIRVNVLAPGWIETEFAERFMQEEYFQERLDEIPMRKFGKPGDVAETAVFLVSDESEYITGEVININGGLI